MFEVGQLISFRGFSSPRYSVRTMEFSHALKQPRATSNNVRNRIVIPDLRHIAVRGFTHSAVKENKRNGEFSMKNQREAIRKIMDTEAFKALTEQTTEINEFQVLT